MNRKEKDFLGEKKIESTAFYGIQTQRAVDNFQITGIPISHTPELIQSLAYVKKSAALANMELGVVPKPIGQAIAQTCDEIIGGQFHDQFVVDVIQGGAGTSTNMNANEVIANRALEIMGHDKGCYDIVHPNNHVNRSQSTNDVYPTALRLALHFKISQLLPAMVLLKKTLTDKGDEFANIIKMGRTQLQDAVPMTLGQEFSSYATAIEEDIKLVRKTRLLIHEINLGATAIGTGINAPSHYTTLVTEILGQQTGIRLTTSANLVEATWDTGAYVQISGVLKRLAVKLSKICNDLRLLSSGPRAGFNEINLPKMQPGSSIMPGKVNPVIPEVVNQVAFQVIGSDLTVTLAAEAGQLELNVMEPVIAHNLFHSLDMLTRSFRLLSNSCIKGITANTDRCAEMVTNSIGIVTAITPLVGYETACALAAEALENDRQIKELILEKNLIPEQKLAGIFSMDNLVHPARPEN